MTIVNHHLTRDGRMRPVCEFCGKVGRPVQARWDLRPGWSSIPNYDWIEHADGSFGTRFGCPDCNKTRGPRPLHPDRLAAARARQAAGLTVR